MGIKLGVDKMYNYISLLGLGSRTKIEMDREASGRLPNSEWKKANLGEEWQPGEVLLKNKQAFRIENGYVHLPEFPGLGLDLDEAAIKEYRLA